MRLQSGGKLSWWLAAVLAVVGSVSVAASSQAASKSAERQSQQAQGGAKAKAGNLSRPGLAKAPQQASPRAARVVVAGRNAKLSPPSSPAARGRTAVAGTGLKVPNRKSVVPLALAKPSFGQLYGLHAADDALDLKSSVALVVDQDTNEVLFSKNPGAVLPIASITKLMTALVVAEAGLSLDEPLTVSQDDIESTAGSRSRLSLGTALSRGDMLHLSLMASENRAAHVLGRSYPGGIKAFVASMNRKAAELGMHSTRYVEPTGLSSDNQSSALDLARLVRAALLHPIIRDLSTSLEAVVPVGARQVQFRNTNGLVRNPDWEIGLQKTGYIAAAGRCVVMQAQLAGRKLIMVLLDSAGKYSRIGDAERLRKWVSDRSTETAPAAYAR